MGELNLENQAIDNEQTKQCEGLSKPFSTDSGSSWTKRPLVVLSLFDGIGGAWAALSSLNIPFIGFSSEVNIHAIQVVKERFPNVRNLGDIRHLKQEDIKEEVDLIIAGFPCQDLSSLGRMAGLHGERSGLFFDMVNVFDIFKPKWFLVENVASMKWTDRDEISKYIRCYPIEIDSQELSASKRKRLYWTNIPYPTNFPRVQEDSISLQSVLENATALQSKLNCIVSCNYVVGGNCQLLRVIDNTSGLMRYINVVEVEKAMGYPAGFTDVSYQFNTNQKRIDKIEHSEVVIIDDSDEGIVEGSKSKKASKEETKRSHHVRWGLLGNSFTVPVIAYLLNPLLNNCVWEERKPFNYYGKVEESKCSMIEVGEIWSLYNTHGTPNWYAVILKTSGGRRLSSSKKRAKKKQPQVEVRFLELSKPYLVGEPDDWSPERGTGLYTLGNRRDTQDMFMFCQRVKGFYKIKKNRYFIYPDKDEVWMVYDRDLVRPTPIYVYIRDTQIKLDSLATAIPGKEEFLAHCKVLQQTVNSDIFRCTNKMLKYTNLRNFCARIPFYYKNESGLLKLEVTNKERIVSADNNHQTRHSKRKRTATEDAMYI